jgi:hypothetical protein
MAPRTWPEVERELAALPRQTVAEVVARAARGALPAVAALEATYGAEAREWSAACDGALRVVEAFARGEPATRFALALAAATARTAAEATALAARERGPSPLVEDAELAYAAVAFAADAARAGSEARAASLAMQAARAAAGGGDVPEDLFAALHSPTPS